VSSGSNQSLRVVPAMHQMLEAAGHRLVGVVTGPGPASRRTDTYLDIIRATPLNIDVIVTTHPKRLAAMLQPLNADLFWVFGFLRILPDDVIRMPRLGTVNTHGGILPQQRGPNAPGWSFRNDVGEIGWTVHRMTSVVDGGPILAQSSVSYGDDDDFDTIAPRWIGLLPEMIMHGLQRIVSEDPGEPQDERKAGYAGMFEPEWRQIDWSNPARLIHNQVRSWVGQRGIPHGAFGEIGGESYLIIRTQLVPDARDATATPGTLLEREGETMLIQCGDGPIRIRNWQTVETE
jgi:methionyl-tRNA formyltransferase